MTKRRVFFIVIVLLLSVATGVGFIAYDNGKYTTYGDVIATEFTKRNLNIERVLISHHNIIEPEENTITFKRALIEDEQIIEKLLNKVFSEPQNMELKKVRTKELDFLVFLEIMTENGNYHIFLHDGFITTRFSETKRTTYQVLSHNLLYQIIDQDLEFIEWEYVSVNNR